MPPNTPDNNPVPSPVNAAPQPAPSAPPPPTPPPLPPLSLKGIPEARMLDADEHVVTIVHRHIIGIVFIYLEALGAVGALIALSVLAFPDLFRNLSRESSLLVMAGLIFATALLFFILFIATYIYRQSILLVTDKSLIQIMQRGLFARKVSRLSMSNVEDVSAEQSGILPTIFNYGTLTIQTAGERENFLFPYCPNPNLYADRVLDARQAYANHAEKDDERT